MKKIILGILCVLLLIPIGFIASLVIEHQRKREFVPVQAFEHVSAIQLEDITRCPMQLTADMQHKIIEEINTLRTQAWERLQWGGKQSANAFELIIHHKNTQQKSLKTTLLLDSGSLIQTDTDSRQLGVKGVISPPYDAQNSPYLMRLKPQQNQAAKAWFNHQPCPR